MRRSGIGELRHRVTLETPVRTGDGGGGAFTAWSPVGDVWAAVTPVSGSETVIAESHAGQITHAIVLRHRTDVAPAMRIRQGLRIFEIAAVMDLDAHRRMQRCQCREVLL